MRSKIARWRCKVCGTVHDGKKPPHRCPRCGASHSLFEVISDPQDSVG